MCNRDEDVDMENRLGFEALKESRNGTMEE